MSVAKNVRVEVPRLSPPGYSKEVVAAFMSLGWEKGAEGRLPHSASGGPSEKVRTLAFHWRKDGDPVFPSGIAYEMF